MTATNHETIFENSSSLYDYGIDNLDTQASVVDEVEQILARAFCGAMAIEDKVLMDEIMAEMDIIADWKDCMLCCDEEGIDYTDTAAFMEIAAS